VGFTPTEGRLPSLNGSRDAVAVNDVQTTLMSHHDGLNFDCIIIIIIIIKNQRLKWPSHQWRSRGTSHRLTKNVSWTLQCLTVSSLWLAVSRETTIGREERVYQRHVNQKAAKQLKDLRNGWSLVKILWCWLAEFWKRRKIDRGVIAQSHVKARWVVEISYHHISSWHSNINIVISFHALWTNFEWI